MKNSSCNLYEELNDVVSRWKFALETSDIVKANPDILDHLVATNEHLEQMIQCMVDDLPGAEDKRTHAMCIANMIVRYIASLDYENEEELEQ